MLQKYIRFRLLEVIMHRKAIIGTLLRIIITLSIQAFVIGATKD